MGMIWTAYRLDAERATRLAEGLAAEDAAAFEQLDELGNADTPEGGDDAPKDAQKNDDPRTLDVDKAWHALDRLYAAAGATSPISTGRIPEAEEVVVGRVDAARVKAVVAGMGRITPAILRRGYDAKKFTREHVYPEIWDEEDVLDVYVMPYDAELRAFYQRAAEAGDDIVWMVS